MKGTVTSVAGDNTGTYSAKIAKTDPPPPGDVVIEVPKWAAEMLLHAIPDIPVEVIQDEGGAVVMVKIG